MKIDDFYYIHRGKVIASLTEAESRLLHPVKIIRAPEGRALLLLHGFSSSPAVYRELIPKLNQYDAIFCPVLPGHGDSIDAFAIATAEKWVSAAETATSDILKNYPTLDVMGLSLGGLLACHLSTRFPLHHLYLLAPALYLKGNVTWMLRLAHLLYALGFPMIRNRAGDMHSSSSGELTYRKLPIKTIISILTYIQKYAWQAPHCPVDVFLGKYDRVVDSAKVEALFKGGAGTTIHWLANSAHVLPLDGDRDFIAKVVSAFIKA